MKTTEQPLDFSNIDSWKKINLPETSCPIEWRVSPHICMQSPPAHGAIEFEEDTPFFVDNDLGEGAQCQITIDYGGINELPMWVELHWTDWNRFEFTELKFTF